MKTDPAPVGAKKDSDSRQTTALLPGYIDNSTTMIAILSLNLLDWLKCAQCSSLARKGKVKTNPAPVGARNDQRHMPITTLLLTVL